MEEKGIHVSNPKKWHKHKSFLVVVVVVVAVVIDKYRLGLLTKELSLFKMVSNFEWMNTYQNTFEFEQDFWVIKNRFWEKNLNHNDGKGKVWKKTDGRDRVSWIRRWVSGIISMSNRKEKEQDLMGSAFESHFFYASLDHGFPASAS